MEAEGEVALSSGYFPFGAFAYHAPGCHASRGKGWRFCRKAKYYPDLDAWQAVRPAAGV